MPIDPDVQVALDAMQAQITRLQGAVRALQRQEPALTRDERDALRWLVEDRRKAQS